jgi:hypothetical protein
VSRFVFFLWLMWEFLAFKNERGATTWHFNLCFNNIIDFTENNNIFLPVYRMVLWSWWNPCTLNEARANAVSFCQFSASHQRLVKHINKPDLLLSRSWHRLVAKQRTSFTTNNWELWAHALGDSKPFLSFPSHCFPIGRIQPASFPFSRHA